MPFPAVLQRSSNFLPFLQPLRVASVVDEVMEGPPSERGWHQRQSCVAVLNTVDRYMDQERRHAMSASMRGRAKKVPKPNEWENRGVECRARSLGLRCTPNTYTELDQGFFVFI